MSYKYFTHGQDQFSKWKLLSPKAICFLKNKYKGENIFYSIQSYDKNGENKHCPLYADFDGETAREDARSLSEQIREIMGVYPHIWDSGSKGYHIILPIKILHPNCELVVKKILLTHFKLGKSWDCGMYKSRAMWRMPNTYNPKGGRFKTYLNNEEDKCDINNLKKDVVNNIIDSAIKEIEKELEKNKHYSNTSNVKKEDALNILPSCLKHFLVNRPRDGIKHYCVFLISVFLSNNGLGENSIIELIESYNNYTDQEMKGVVDTVKRACHNPYQIGCGVNSRFRDIMKEQCIGNSCPFFKE